MQEILSSIIHFDKHLDLIIKNCGNWSYILLFLIVFAETGLVVTPFLPGDSLLFIVGAFSAQGSLNFGVVFVVLAGAAIIGDSVNYACGKIFGEKLIQRTQERFIKKEHLARTHKFFERYGGKTIILARFVPIVRTFAPFVAGLGCMSYPKFFIYNVIGGLLWVALFTCAGFYFGNSTWVQQNFSFFILLVIIISLLPIFVEYLRHRRSKK